MTETEFKFKIKATIELNYETSYESNEHVLNIARIQIREAFPELNNEHIQLEIVG